MSGRGGDYDVDDIKTVRVSREPEVRPLGVRVTIAAGPEAGQSFPLARRVAIVGRSPAADVRLSDPTVSSFHFEIAAVPGGVHVVDLESANGTWYGGARLERATVPSGAMLEIGRSIVRLDVDAPFAAEASEVPAFGEMRGQSRPMRELFSMVERLCRTDLSVLIEGPTGSGKELVARALHDFGRTPGGPFMVLDCTAIPATLAESMLFGHERGSFTGAIDRRIGIFEAAQGGTIFLDEIGELPLDLQPKLLRVLERREVQRVGGSKPIPIQVRVLTATWRDVRAMINQGKFREDLYFRLAQARVSVPSLRERPDDIPVLVHHFLQKVPREVQAARAITEGALQELVRRDYPGNVRELKSTVDRAAMTAAADVITETDLAFERMLSGQRAHAPATPTPSLPPPGPSGELGRFKDVKRTLIDEFERDYLQRLLAKTGNNLSKAAQIAGVERHHLRDLFRKHGLRGDD
ncbi:MAG: sigma 54-dependent Fis family transcriptional regulator [Deltaproteobacteria bacterium]|nr:sigma 54-dependent Fis family transcriptional regulator [Deltaproteobacteria bacterium]